MPLGSSAGVGSGVDLKDAEEVKQYIENLGIEYRFGCYQEKNPSSCHLLGDYWESVKKDHRKAFKIYEANCELRNHGHSCHKVAGYRYYGKICQQDGDISYNLFKKACDGGYVRSCLNVGLLDFASPDSKEYFRTVPPDKAVGLQYFKKACEEGNIAEGCHRYATAFIRGIKNICQQDMETAFKYSLRACELGNVAACTNVTVMYNKGEGVEKNPVAAKEYAKITKDMLAQLRQEQIKFGQEGAE